MVSKMGPKNADARGQANIVWHFQDISRSFLDSEAF